MVDNLSRQAWIIGLTVVAMLSSCAKISGLDDLKIPPGTGGTTSNGRTGNTGGATNSGGDATTGGTTSNAGAGNTGGATNSGGDATTGGTTSNAGTGNTGGATNTGGAGTTGGAGCNAVGSGYQEGDIRLCSEGGLLGPCTNGNQACRKDGTWSPCTIKPKAADTCVEGNDDNCNGVPNEGCQCIVASTRSCAAGGALGNCGKGQQICGSDGTWGTCSVQAVSADTCDQGDDANCNGTSNEGCQCIVTSTRSCAAGGALGNCGDGQQLCGSDGTWGTCSVQAVSADTCDQGDDANCNGTPNEGCTCINGNTQSCGDMSERGICHHGVSTCQGGHWGDCIASVGPAARDCRSSADNDCDGLPDDTIDTVCLCTVGETQDCGETHPGLDGKGQCRSGTQACVASTNATSSSWGTCSGWLGPSPEVCDGIDNNCDDHVDEGCTCPRTGGPEMVFLLQGYCIDITEVTRAQYAAWLATNPTLPDSTDANCGWKTTYTPSCDWPYDNTRPNNPVGCVDWCGAYAYCAGVGKRLCGKIGGGANAYADYANASLSQWYNACTSGGVYGYPYGNTYQASYCDGSDYGTKLTVEVGSLSNCVTSATGYAGVYDLSGNVFEWEDSCNGTGQLALCRLRGGSFDNGSNYLTCGDGGNYERDNGAYSGMGFRCCAP